MRKFSLLVRERFQGRHCRLLDVGSKGVNGTYKEVFEFPGIEYVGLDVELGPNVDITPRNPYDWAEIADASFDVIISGQVLEHVEFPWLTMEQIGRKLKPGGLVSLVVPSRGPEHRFPVDCYRYYPDGLRALAKWAGLKVLEVDYFRDTSGFADGSDQWGDCHALLTKVDSADRPTIHAPSSGRHRTNPLNLPKNAPYFAFPRDDVRDFLKHSAVQARRVLEVGCASGIAGVEIKKTVGAEFYCGIDSSPAAVAEARSRLDAVHLANLETTPLASLALQRDDFDMIVALDVLEHLYNPWDLLAELTTFLKPGGFAVISVPNIQNLAILNDLVNGRWTYEAAGLLDVTHLRFFTLESLENLIAGAGLQKIRIDSILNPPVDLANMSPTGIQVRQDKLHLADLTKEEMVRFCTYQYLILAQKPNPNGELGADR